MRFEKEFLKKKLCRYVPRTMRGPSTRRVVGGHERSKALRVLQTNSKGGASTIPSMRCGRSVLKLVSDGQDLELYHEFKINVHSANNLSINTERRRRARSKSENRYIRVFDSAAACTVHRVVRKRNERGESGCLDTNRMHCVIEKD
jgi:hypothetical protein